MKQSVALSVAGLALAGFAAGFAGAQGYPVKPIGPICPTESANIHAE